MFVGSPVCWPRFCSFPMCFEGFCPPVWASGRCLPCCGRCCGHGLARQIRHVAGVLSRCGSSSRCFRSQTVGLLPLCTLSWLRSLPLSGLSYPSCLYGRRSVGPVLFFPDVFLRSPCGGVYSNGDKSHIEFAHHVGVRIAHHVGVRIGPPRQSGSKRRRARACHDSPIKTILG
jgi:hypothetical protein